ncbi:hypothetical protein KQX54_019091 [Cotesia glomerata]|uniref:Uncharacterized protein n=1 Tax=Cotesia glomerata TaxID=32391 RepID=A0AAV7IAY4_COTGL|nr:hypothetical protein KQX54_019091 [Cotesia glomerata]
MDLSALGRLTVMAELKKYGGKNLEFSWKISGGSLATSYPVQEILNGNRDEGSFGNLFRRTSNSFHMIKLEAFQGELD